MAANVQPDRGRSEGVFRLSGACGLGGVMGSCCFEFEFSD